VQWVVQLLYIASMEGPNVAVYSVMDSPVIIASMHRGTKCGSECIAIDSAVSRASRWTKRSIACAMDSPVIRASMGDQMWQ